MGGLDGIDGKDGAPGRDGRDGINGSDGEPGIPGERALPPVIAFGDPEEIELDADQLRRVRAQRVSIAGVEMTLLILSDD
jgi:hypothetical protein